MLPSAPRPLARLIASMRWTAFAYACLPTIAFWIMGSGIATAQSFPPVPPPSLVWDDTRALPQPAQERISSTLLAFRERTGCDFHLAAVTSLPGQVQPRVTSRTLRRQWSLERPAFLLLYSRGIDGSSISVSPKVWELYPAAQLIATLQAAGEILGNKALPLEERLQQAVELLTRRIEKLETIRRQRSAGPSADDLRSSALFASLLAGLAVMGILLGWRSRRRQHSRSSPRFFPQAAVGIRLGAPFGGGVIAESHPRRN